VTDQEKASQSGVHHATVRGARASLAKKEISGESFEAVLVGNLSLEEARELGRNAGPGGPVVRVNKNDRAPTKTPCLCGCGELVPKIFKAGHDMRMVKLAKAYVRGNSEPNEDQMAYLEESGKLEKARAQVAKDEQRRREKAERQKKTGKKNEG
jgi:hypothetical protein